MILVDANLLIYAKVDTYLEHAAACAWLNQQINGAVRVAVPWASLLGFLRVCANPRVHANPLTTADASAQIEAWLGLAAVWTPEAGEHHRSILLNLLRTTNARGNLVHDAHLAALAIEHGLTPCSADTDFVRFPGLRWINPIAST